MSKDATLDASDSHNEEHLCNSIKVLGAYGTKAKGFGTSSFLLNDKNVIDAGNLLESLQEKSIEVEKIWITHAHLDHICDIAYIIDAYYDFMQTPIVLCGMKKTLSAIQEHFLNNVIWPDFSKIQLQNKSDVCIKYMEINLDKEYLLSDKETIRAFKTDHTVSSCGYIYTKNNSSILITADTYEIENIIEILNHDRKINSMIVECSFPSSMDLLAQESKHLTPKLLSKRLESLKRDNLEIYINHMKPMYLKNISDEIATYCQKWAPKTLKDEEIVKF